MRDLECMSVKYPPPPLSPITRKDVINDGDDETGSHRTMERFGYHDHVMPPPMKMSLGGSSTAAGIPGQNYGFKGSVANIPTNDYEVSVRGEVIHCGGEENDDEEETKKRRPEESVNYLVLSQASFYDPPVAVAHVVTSLYGRQSGGY